MAGLNIGDVFMRVLADMTGFEADVTKAAGKAGDKAGATLGSRLKKGMTVGLGAVGAGAGVLFSVAARGAAELTDAMARFQAETGATQEELDSARKSVLELSKTNLQSFDQIAATQAKLRTDLGLTQAEAEKATDAFLKYGTATGRDATEGVAALDDILDAWNLDSSKSTEIMDKLVASHQKYGGSLTDNEASLNALAPQLQALNLNVDDGISLLNLFAAGGLDASKAQFALNSAIQKLPPGTSLEDFVAHLASIEDPAQRATEAIKVFGARGGAGLANVIRPGMKGLDDFAIGMNESAGATERAAKAIEDTPFNQLKMALRSIAAPAIEAGQAFGPLLLALSQLGGGRLIATITGSLGGLAGALSTKLGPKLKDGLVKAFGRVVIPSSALTGITNEIGEGIATNMGRSTRLGGAFEKVGGLFGGRFGTAFKLAALLAIVAIADELLPKAEQLGKDLHDKIFPDDGGPLGQLGDALEEFGDSVADLPWPLGPKGQPDWASIGTRTKQGVETAVTKPVIEAMSGTAGNAGKAFDDSFEVSPSRIGKTIDDAVRAGASTAGSASAGRSVGSRVASGVAQGLYDVAIQKQSVVQNAFQLLLSASKDTMHKVDEINYLVGVLTSKELAAGLTDSRASVRAAAEETRAAAFDRLKELRINGGNVGKQAIDALAKGMKSKNPTIRQTTRQTNDLITSEIRNAKTRPAGQTAGQNVANGLNDKRTAVGNAAWRLGVAIYQSLIHSVQFSQAHHTNPKPPERRAGGGATEAGEIYVVGEHGQELFVPKTDGTIIPNDKLSSYSSEPTRLADGQTVINLETYGLPMRAETPAEVAAQLRRVGRVAPRKRLSWAPS
jgi:hypothetical protein